MSDASERPEPAGNLALDFLNTAFFSRGRPLDLARTPDELVAWLHGSGLLDETQRAVLAAPGARRLLHTEARRLRPDLGILVEAFATGSAPPDAAVFGLNRVLAAGRASHNLRVDFDPPALLLREHGAPPLAVLAPVARAAAGLLIEADPARVRRCASALCATWFLDTSKGGQRRWCSMARCGNRAKARRHRTRLSVGR